MNKNILIGVLVIIVVALSAVILTSDKSITDNNFVVTDTPSPIISSVSITSTIKTSEN